MPDESSLQRVVVDTNVFIRGILSTTGASAQILDAIFRRQCLLISSRQHLSEIHRVLSRPCFIQRYSISPNQRHRLITRLYRLSIFVAPIGHLTICRDPKDDYLIEMALLGQANYLVSEDQDLHDDAGIIELLDDYNTRLIQAGEFIRHLPRP